MTDKCFCFPGVCLCLIIALLNEWFGVIFRLTWYCRNHSQIFELLSVTSPTNCWLSPRNDPPDERSNSQLLLFLSLKHFSLLFSSLRRAHRPTGSAFVCCLGNCKSPGKNYDLSSIISLPFCVTPLLLLLCFLFYILLTFFSPHYCHF